ncbi:MAG: CaiB/BaiF CoA-transferase family protein [Phototrophicaceae bacterium]
MPQHALDGVRVLDFTRVLAGPLCTMILADLGAEVIKVENVGRGDDTRQWGPPWLGDMSAYFASVNRNKQSITLNLKSKRGIKIARELAQDSQIVVENFKIGQMASFGLGYDDLIKLNPKLVYCSITGFGQTGSFSQYAGYDYAIQAMSGLMSITGEKEGQPHKVGVAISDVIAGLFANTAILSALRHAEKTGQGQHIDIALLDTQIASLVNIVSNYLVSGQNPPRYGNQHQNIVPYQTFSARDQDFVLAVGNDKQFRLLSHLIQLPDLPQDERFATNPLRVQHREVLIPILQTAFNAKKADEWVSLLLDAGIPAGSINTVEQALNMPQITERNLVHEVALSTGDLLKMVGSPLKLSETPPEIRTPPPQLGEHTENVLSRLLNLSQSDISQLKDEGVV